MKNNILLRAISTPLSSIFGSGFLVIIPILAGAVGEYSFIAMAIVCLFAYAVGGVIRYNIKKAEPLLDGDPKRDTLSFERLSDFALIAAYVISVCLYLQILSSFVLGGLDMNTEFNENILTTVILLVIVFIGLTKGLKALSVLEKIGLIFTLVIIVILIIGFGYYDYIQWKSPEGIIPYTAIKHSNWEMITIVAGTLIVVQGFETTRYLGKDFTADIRVKASKYSQLISTVVYLLFILVAIPVVHTLNGEYDDNSLIKLVGVVSSLLVLPLIITAALSQFSAAVADAEAAIGNMEELTKKQISRKLSGVLIGVGAIILTWSANTLELISFASRGFAFYYFLQCLVAISVSETWIRKVYFLLISIILLFIAIFAVPAG